MFWYQIRGRGAIKSDWASLYRCIGSDEALRTYIKPWPSLRGGTLFSAYPNFRNMDQSYKRQQLYGALARHMVLLGTSFLSVVFKEIVF